MKRFDNVFLWMMLSVMLCFSIQTAAQERQGVESLSEQEYQELKASGALPQPAQVAVPKSLRPENIIAPTITASMNGLMVPLDSTFSVVPFTNGAPPEYRNDDGSTSPIPLSFTFTFYGAQYSEVYINNNGNLSFEGSYSSLLPLASRLRILLW